MRHRPLTRGATSLDAALVGAGPELAAPPLARLGSRLRATDLGPGDVFRADLRAQLCNAAAVAAPARPADAPETVGRSLGWFATRLTAGIAAAGVMVTGVGVASARALPGDALYGLKRDTEAVQLNLAHGDSARGLLHLQFAASRLSEVHALLNRAGIASPTSPQVDQALVPTALAGTLRSTLAAMDADTSTGASELTHSFLAGQKGASLSKLAAFTSRQETALTSVLPALPAPAAAASLSVLHTVAAQTTALLAEPTQPTPVTPTPATSAEPAASPSTTAAAPVVSASPSPSATATPADSSPGPSAAPSSAPSTATSTTSPSDAPGPTESPSASPTPSLDAQSPTPAPSSKPSSSPSASASAAAPTTFATAAP